MNLPPSGNYLRSQGAKGILNIRLQNPSSPSSFVCAVDCFQVIPDAPSSNTLNSLTSDLLKLPEQWAHVAQRSLSQREPISFHWIIASPFNGRPVSSPSQERVSETRYRETAGALLSDLLEKGLKKLRERVKDTKTVGETMTSRGEGASKRTVELDGKVGREQEKAGDSGLGLLRSLPHQHYLLSLLDDIRRDSALRFAGYSAQSVGPIGEAFLKMYSFLTWPLDQFLPGIKEILVIGAWLEKHGQLEILCDLLQHQYFRLTDATHISRGIEKRPSLSVLRMLLHLFPPAEVIWVARHTIERYREPEALSLFESCMLRLSNGGGDHQGLQHEEEDSSSALVELIWPQLSSLPFARESWSEASPFNNFFRLLVRHHLGGLTTKLLISSHESTVPEIILMHMDLFRSLLGGDPFPEDSFMACLEAQKWQEMIRLLDYFLMLADGIHKSLTHFEDSLMNFISQGLLEALGSNVDDTRCLHHLVHMNVPYVLARWVQELKSLICEQDETRIDMLIRLRDEQTNWRSLAVIVKYLKGKGPKTNYFYPERTLLDYAILRLHEPSVITLEREAEVISLGLGAEVRAMSDDSLLVLLQIIAYTKLNIPLWIVEDARWEGQGETSLDLREITGLIKKWYTEDWKRRSEIIPLPTLKVSYHPLQGEMNIFWMA